MTTTHDLPTVAGWWRGEDIRTRRALGFGAAGEDEERTAGSRARCGAPSRRAGTARRRAAARRPADAAVDAALGYVAQTPSPLVLVPLEDLLGLDEQPNLPGTIDEHPNWRRRLDAARRRPARRARSRARLRLDHRRRIGHDPARHASGCSSTGLHLRRCRGAGALFRAPGRQPSLCLADRRRAAGLDARLRRDRSDDGQSRTGRRGGLARAGRPRSPRRARPDRRHRAQPHGGRRRRTPGGPTCCATAAPAATPACSTSTGRPTRKVLLPILGKPWRRRWPRARSSGRRASIRYFSPSPAACAGDPVASRCAGAAALSPGLVAHRRRSHQLAALLRHQRAGLPAHGGDEAFERVHALILRLYAEGTDRRRAGRSRRRAGRSGGLLPQAAPAARSRGAGPAYLVVEKILLRGETLPADWGCDGTTGYDFMDEVSALQHDPAGEPRAGRGVGRAQRPAGRFRRRRSRRRAARSWRAAFGASSRPASTPSRGHRAARLEPRRRCAASSTELLAHFPVYRTYATAGGDARAADDAVLAMPSRGAKTDRASPATAGRSTVLRDWLRDRRRTRRPLATLPAVERAGRGQVGRGHRLLSLRPSAVAQRCRLRSARFAVGRRLPRRDARAPATHFRTRMLATATHDHKRGEDVRARLAVLSEMADEWARHRRDWIEASAPLRRRHPTPATSRCCCRPSSAPGRSISTLDDARARGLRRAARRLAGEGAARGQAAQRLGRAERGLRESRARLRSLAWSPRRPPDAAAARSSPSSQRIAPAGAVNGLAQACCSSPCPACPISIRAPSSGTSAWSIPTIAGRSIRRARGPRWATPTWHGACRAGATGGSSRP